MESGREPSSIQKLEHDGARLRAEEIIKGSDLNNLLNSTINEGVVKAMMQKQKNAQSQIHNWLMVFDWNSGSFVSWDVVNRTPGTAMKAYVDREHQFPADQGYEVVMVGASDPSMIRHTHSHYFGIQSYESVLSTLEGSISGISKRMDIGIGPRQILQCMARRKYWTASKSIRRDTLKNHYCKAVVGFDESLDWLIEEGLVLSRGAKGALFLNVKEKTRIEASF